MTEYTEDSFVDIPMPSVIEEEDGYRDTQLELTRAKDYGRQLWIQLSAVTSYLRTDLARGEGLAGDDQWAGWQEVYARSLSILAGPAGDNGYGRSQATLERQHQQ